MIIGDWPFPEPWERPGSPYTPGQQPWKPPVRLPYTPIIPPPRDGDPYIFPPKYPGFHVEYGFAQSPEFLDAFSKYHARIKEELEQAAERQRDENKRIAEEKAIKEKEKRRQLFEELKKEFKDE